LLLRACIEPTTSRSEKTEEGLVVLATCDLLRWSNARLSRVAWLNGLRRLAEFEFGLAGVGGRGLGVGVACARLRYIFHCRSFFNFFVSFARHSPSPLWSCSQHLDNIPINGLGCRGCSLTLFFSSLPLSPNQPALPTTRDLYNNINMSINSRRRRSHITLTPGKRDVTMSFGSIN
jgi:hypothetical protein